MEIDLNADLGEYTDAAGHQHERAVMRYISSCNIACGGHIGNKDSIRHTMLAAHDAGLAVGLHPSYPDQAGFGRRSMDIKLGELRAALSCQIDLFFEVADAENITPTHIKLHGALYNDAAKRDDLAELISVLVQNLDRQLALVSLPHSKVRDHAKARNIKFIAEGFVDRTYQHDGSLTPRSTHGAVIKTQKVRVAQAVRLATENKVFLEDGTPIDLPVETLCLHGDSEGAVETARDIRGALAQEGVKICHWSLFQAA